MSAIDHIGQLTPDPANRRKHNPRNVGMIASSLGEVGAARSIVIDENGYILAGNATIEAAAQAGIERVRVVETDGEEIVAVRRIGLTDAQKRRLAIADNRTAELAEWDVDQLLADLDAGESFDGLFAPYELDALLGQLNAANDPGTEWVGMPEFQQDDLMAAHRVVVNFRTLADLESFEHLISQSVPKHVRNAGSIWFPKVEPLRVADKGFVSDEP